MSENLFGDETPASTDAADGVDYSLGVRFVPAVAGNVTAGRWRFPATAMTGVTIGVYEVSGPTLLGSKVFTGATTNAWNEVAFDSPISVSAGTTYAVVVWTPSHYVATTSYPWPKTSTGGNLTAGSANAWFLASTGSLTFPTSQSGNSASYFPDVVFAPAAASADAALTVTAGFSAAATGERSAAAALAATVTLSAGGLRTADASVALAVTAALTSVDVITKPADAALAVTATLAAGLLGATASAPGPTIRTTARDRTLRTAVRGG